MIRELQVTPGTPTPLFPCGDGARDVRAVSIVVGRVVVPFDEVPAAPIVDVAVAVVVDAVRAEPGSPRWR